MLADLRHFSNPPSSSCGSKLSDSGYSECVSCSVTLLVGRHVPKTSRTRLKEMIWCAVLVLPKEEGNATELKNGGVLPYADTV